MSAFDSYAVVDWSSGNDTGPRPRTDAIWLGLNRDGQDEPPRYLRNRIEAEAAISALIEAHLTAGKRLFIGFDFPFAFPRGFAEALTGTPDPFAVWHWLDARLEDRPRANNRFDLAGQINAVFPGIGPFWFNGLRRDIPHLPRKDTRDGHGMAERRAVEYRAKGSFACWQMGGAGAVGGQVLTGLPFLNRLRARFAPHVAAWPFEALKTPVALVEIWPGLINPVVRRAETQGGIRDAHQVHLLARAIGRLPAPERAAMLAEGDRQEGWIMGVGFEHALQTAAEGD